MSFLKKLLGVNAIENPKIGFYSLLDSEVQELLVKDKAEFEKLFCSCEVGESNPPKCDVLFFYVDVENSASTKNVSDMWSEVLSKSGAKILVVASENSGASYMSSADEQKFRANIVLTIERKGELFLEFFSSLFSNMFQGVSMPQAWVKLAPQIPNEDHLDCPEAIFICQAGQITFAKK